MSPRSFLFPSTGPLGLECWIANTLKDWNSWTPLSQTLSSGVFRVPGWSYFFGRVILCGRQRDFLRPHFSTSPSILFCWSLQWQIVGGQDIRRTSLVFVGWFASPPKNMPLEIWMSFWLVVHGSLREKPWPSPPNRYLSASWSLCPSKRRKESDCPIWEWFKGDWE